MNHMGKINTERYTPKDVYFEEEELKQFYISNIDYNNELYDLLLIFLNESGFDDEYIEVKAYRHKDLDLYHTLSVFHKGGENHVYLESLLVEIEDGLLPIETITYRDTEGLSGTYPISMKVYEGIMLKELEEKTQDNRFILYDLYRMETKIMDEEVGAVLSLIDEYKGSEVKQAVYVETSMVDEYPTEDGTLRKSDTEVKYEYKDVFEVVQYLSDGKVYGPVYTPQFLEMTEEEEKKQESNGGRGKETRKQL